MVNSNAAMCSGLNTSKPRVALVHDWLTGMRGGERCLEAFLKLYPDADVLTLLHKPGSCSPMIEERVTQTSFLQRIPGISKYYRLFLPLYPMAIKSLDTRGYDFVISLSHAAAKNVKIHSDTVHVSYCFTPMRYAWDQVQSYFGKITPLLWPILMALRKWDKRRSTSVDHFVSISRFVSARIRCFYGRASTVIYPPVDTDWIPTTSAESPGEAFLYAGALVPYKRPDLAVRACTELGLPLWVAGTGSEEERLRKIAGPSVKFLGRVSDEELASLYEIGRAHV